MPLTRRPATAADVPFLLELRRLTMDAHLAAAGLSLSDANHLQRVEVDFDAARVLEQDGRPVGLLKLARRGLEWELVQIQLAPALQGGGHGRALLEELIAEARQAGATVRLSVLKVNPARRLYERLGFVVETENEHSFGMVCGGTAALATPRRPSPAAPPA